MGSLVETHQAIAIHDMHLHAQLPVVGALQNRGKKKLSGKLYGKLADKRTRYLYQLGKASIGGARYVRFTDIWAGAQTSMACWLPNGPQEGKKHGLGGELWAKPGIMVLQRCGSWSSAVCFWRLSMPVSVLWCAQKPTWPRLISWGMRVLMLGMACAKIGVEHDKHTAVGHC